MRSLSAAKSKLPACGRVTGNPHLTGRLPMRIGKEEVPAYAQDDHVTIEVPPANNSSRLLSLLNTTPRLPERPLYPMGLGYLHQSPQNPQKATSWGFDSPSQHQIISSLPSKSWLD
jgi:hypothetical protein